MLPGRYIFLKDSFGFLLTVYIIRMNRRRFNFLSYFWDSKFSINKFSTSHMCHILQTFRLDESTGVHPLAIKCRESLLVWLSCHVVRLRNVDIWVMHSSILRHVFWSICLNFVLAFLAVSSNYLSIVVVHFEMGIDDSSSFCDIL